MLIFIIVFSSTIVILTYTYCAMRIEFFVLFYVCVYVCSDMLIIRPFF